FDALKILDEALWDSQRDALRAALEAAGDTFVAGGRYFDAIAIYERLNRLPGSDGAYHLEVARLYEGIDDDSARRDAIKRYVDSAPDDPSRAAAAGRYLSDSARYGEAEPYLARAAVRGSDAALWLAEARLSLGNEPGAREAFALYLDGAVPENWVVAAELANRL